jgi:hypothetical protein
MYRYSGIAWVLLILPQEINIILTWKSELPTSYDLYKVPLALTYNSKDTIILWGYKLEAY